MVTLSRNPLFAPTQPASSPVGGIARVRQMLGRVAQRVRKAFTRTPAGPKPRPPKAQTQPAAHQIHPAHAIDDALIEDFCAGETIGEIFASFCRILNIGPSSPIYPANLIAITQTPEQFAATRPPDCTPTKPTPHHRPRARPTRPLPQAAAPKRTPHQHPQSPPHRAPTIPTLHPRSPPPIQTARTHDPPRKKPPTPISDTHTHIIPV